MYRVAVFYTLVSASVFVPVSSSSQADCPPAAAEKAPDIWLLQRSLEIQQTDDFTNATSRLNATDVTGVVIKGGVINMLSIRESCWLFVQFMVVLTLATWALQGGFGDQFRFLVAFAWPTMKLHDDGDITNASRHLPRNSGTLAACIDVKPGTKVAEDRRLPSSLTIPGLVEEQSERLPAIGFLQRWAPNSITQTLTFKELALAVDSASAVLCSVGVRDGVYLGILSQGTQAYQVYLLGCMKAGAVPVLLSWRQPVDQMASMAKVANCQALLASEHYAAQAAEIQRRLAILSSPFIIEHLKADHRPQASVQSFKSSDCAAVIFTSGSTSTPKAVPHSHYGLLGNCRNILVAKASAFPPLPGGGAQGGTVCFLPNFHAIGLTVNFLFNLYAGVRCSVLEHPHATPVTPELILEACADLRPSVLSTVPWIIEKICQLLSRGDASTACLRDIHHIAFAGGQLPSTCATVLREHNIKAAVDYGQTELGGPLLIGNIGGDLACMRPVPGVTYMLHTPVSVQVRGNQTRGELVLFGAKFATRGYLPGSEGRRLCPADCQTHQEFWTGDIFEEVSMFNGETLLRHCSRNDDLLVHTSGEMTNPLPIEHILLEESVVHNVCVLGDGYARPVLVLELQAVASSMQPTDLAELIWSKVQQANRAQPEWSEVLPQHVVCLFGDKDEGIPVSVKGNVQRQLLHKRMSATLSFLLSDGPPPDERITRATTWLKDNLDSETECVTHDSLSFGTDMQDRVPAEEGYFYLICIVGVVLKHYTKHLFSHISSQSDLEHLMMKTALVSKSVSLQGFSLYAGFKDLKTPPTWRSILQLFIWVLAGQVLEVVITQESSRTGWQRSPDQLILWFLGLLMLMRMLFMATEHMASPAVRGSLRILIGLFVHFASSGQGPWPFFYRDVWGTMRQPYQWPETLQGPWDGMLKVHLRNEGNHLFIMYFTFSYVLKHLPRALRASSDSCVGKAGFTMLAIMLGVYQGYHFKADDPSYKAYYADQSWLKQACDDVQQHVIQFALLMCIMLAVPKSRSVLSDVGGQSLTVYWLNQPLRFLVIPFALLINHGAFVLSSGLPENVAVLFIWICMMCAYVVITCLLGMAALLPFDRVTASAVFLVVMFGQYYLCSLILGMFPR